MSSITQTENIPMTEMKSKVQMEGYTTSGNYHRDFLEVIAQSAINNQLNYLNTIDIDRQLIHFKATEMEDGSLPAHTLNGFFRQIHKFNDYEELKEDEYFVGLYGNVNSNYFKMDAKTTPSCVLGVNKLYLISNYLNIFSVVNQYDLTPQNLDKTFEERYRLWPQKQNNVLLFDSQIEDISTCFQNLNVELTNMDLCRKPNSIIHYGKTNFNGKNINEYMLKVLSQHFSGFHQDMLKLLTDHDAEWKNMEEHLKKVDEELSTEREMVSTQSEQIKDLEETKSSLEKKLETQSEEHQETQQKCKENEKYIQESLLKLQEKFHLYQQDFEGQKEEMLDYKRKLQESCDEASTVQTYVSQLDKRNKELLSMVSYYKWMNFVSWTIICSLFLAWYMEM